MYGYIERAAIQVLKIMLPSLNQPRPGSYPHALFDCRSARRRLCLLRRRHLKFSLSDYYWAGGAPRAVRAGRAVSNPGVRGRLLVLAGGGTGSPARAPRLQLALAEPIQTSLNTSPEQIPPPRRHRGCEIGNK